jgi:hypothetical protein
MRAQFIWMPSKELLLALPLNALAYAALRRQQPDADADLPLLHLLCLISIAAPVLPVALVIGGMVVAYSYLAASAAVSHTLCGPAAAFDAALRASFASTDVRIHLFLGALVAALVGAEHASLYASAPGLTAADWVTLGGHVAIRTPLH